MISLSVPAESPLSPSFVSDHFLSGGRGVSLRTSAAFLLLIFHVHISAVNFLPVSD